MFTLPPLGQQKLPNLAMLHQHSAANGDISSGQSAIEQQSRQIVTAKMQRESQQPRPPPAYVRALADHRRRRFRAGHPLSRNATALLARPDRLDARHSAAPAILREAPPSRFRSPQVSARPDIDYRSLCEKIAGQVVVSSGLGYDVRRDQHERLVAVATRRVDVGPSLDQKLDQRAMTAARSLPQQRPVMAAGGLPYDIRIAGYQPLDGFQVRPSLLA